MPVLSIAEGPPVRGRGSPMALTFVILSDRRERRISFAANETLRYAQGDKCGVVLLPQMREKLVPLGVGARSAEAC